MKIALATTSLSKFGGSASYQNHLALQLRAAGHTIGQYRIGHVDGTDGQIMCVDKSAIHGLDKKFEAERDQVLAWPDLWKRHDVVHITNPGALHIGFDEAQLFGAKHGPLVLTIHDPHEIEVLGPTLIKLCELADMIVFIGRRYCDAFCSAGYVKGGSKKACHLIQPYTRVAPADKKWPKRRRAICTSPWRPVKRVDLIVKAAELLPLEGPEAIDKIEFWSGDGIDYIEDIVESLPGYVNCDDKGAWEDNLRDVVYGSARVLVNMTFFDATDTGRTEYPILEAWDYQVIPVVARDFIGDPIMRRSDDQLLEHRHNCIVVDPAPISIARGILDGMKLALPAERFAYCLERHGAMAEPFLDVYREAIERCGGISS